MMLITLIPQNSGAELSLSKVGDTLIINGDDLDFSDLPEGGEYPEEAIDNEFVIGGVKRLGGAIQISILMPYSNPDAPTEVTFPAPLKVTMDGDISLPVGRGTEVDDANQ